SVTEFLFLRIFIVVNRKDGVWFFVVIHLFGFPLHFGFIFQESRPDKHKRHPAPSEPVSTACMFSRTSL
ncbi:TPA: hypothetical protein ACYSD8_003851, partial [Citrobacter freundii]